MIWQVLGLVFINFEFYLCTIELKIAGWLPYFFFYFKGWRMDNSTHGMAKLGDLMEAFKLLRFGYIEILLHISKFIHALLILIIVRWFNFGTC